MTPDSFFNIKPDLKPGTVHRDTEHSQSVYRPKEPPTSSKDFKKILDNDQDSESASKEIHDKAKEIPEEKDKLAKQDPTATKKEMTEQFVKDTTQPDYEIDPRFNQTASLGKESKVAPKLGKEISVAPAEEPRAAPYVESDKGGDKGVVLATEEDAASELAKRAQRLPKAVPLEKVEMETPANVVIEKPKTPTVADKTFAKEGSSEDAISSLHSKTKRDLASLTDGRGDQLAAGLPLPGQASTVAQGIVQQTPAAGQIPEHIKQIAEQIASNITVIADKTQTETTITLNHPTTFHGATVTVTSFATAPGEFNVTFENLTQEAKNILDLADNRNALKQALDQKGLIVHMITTTTVEKTQLGEAYTSGRDSRGEARGGEGGKQQEEEREEKQ